MRLLITIERCDWSHWRFKFQEQVGTGISYYTTWPVGGQAETYIEFPGQEFALGPFSITAGRPGFWQRAWSWLCRRRWPK